MISLGISGYAGKSKDMLCSAKQLMPRTWHPQWHYRRGLLWTDSSLVPGTKHPSAPGVTSFLLENISWSNLLWNQDWLKDCHQNHIHDPNWKDGLDTYLREVCMGDLHVTKTLSTFSNSIRYKVMSGLHCTTKWWISCYKGSVKRELDTLQSW